MPHGIFSATPCVKLVKYSRLLIIFLGHDLLSKYIMAGILKEDFNVSVCKREVGGKLFLFHRKRSLN
jgi:hypothetical protein